VRIPERGEQLLADRRPAPEPARLEADVLHAEILRQTAGTSDRGREEAIGDLLVVALFKGGLGHGASACEHATDQAGACSQVLLSDVVQVIPSRGAADAAGRRLGANDGVLGSQAALPTRTPRHAARARSDPPVEY